MQEQKSKELTAKDIPAPEPPKMELVKEDFFGPIPEEKLGKLFWIQVISSLLVFGIGFIVGLTIGGNVL